MDEFKLEFKILLLEGDFSEQEAALNKLGKEGWSVKIGFAYPTGADRVILERPLDE